MPFALYQSDMQFINELSGDIAALGLADAQVEGSVAAPRPHSECVLGLLTLRAVLIFTQMSSLPSRSPRRTAELLPEVLAVPWSELLLSGWPIFTALALLARWASPHADQRTVQIAGTHARAASQAARALGACSCDAAEAGAVAGARRLLGRLWRHRDVSAPASPGASFAAEALAGMDGSVWGGDAGLCRWTQHPGWVLGSMLGTIDDGGGGLLSAMAVCDREPACVGITVQSSEEPNGRPSFTLRGGEPLLAKSPSGEHSYTRWCLDPPPQADPSRAVCPFAQASGLLATAWRRLSRGSMANFSAELVVEAQGLLTDWASRVDSQLAGTEAWTTEWPLWELLGRLQQRVELLRSPVSSAGAQPQPWSLALQTFLGFGDEAFMLALEELTELVGSDGLQGRLPADLREGVGCSTGRQCLGELYARLHVLLHSSGRLPLRDPIFMDADDTLAPLYIARGTTLEQAGDYDWGELIQESKERLMEGRDEVDSRSELLDRLMPNAHPLQVDRRQLASFILDVRDIVAPRPLGRCLEWDQPFLLVRAFQGFCQWFDIFSYSEPHPDEPRMGMPGRHEYAHGTRHYWGDLEYPGGLGIEPDTFDLILCPFVFEHVSKPFLAMRNLAKVLKSGGYIIWSAPMFQSYHGSPHDYFRYTPNGARSLAEDSGLEVVKLYTPGDLGLASGVMHGMMLPYWTEQQALGEHPPEPKEDYPRHPLNVFALMRKPPSAGAGAGAGS